MIAYTMLFRENLNQYGDRNFFFALKNCIAIINQVQEFIWIVIAVELGQIDIYFLFRLLLVSPVQRGLPNEKSFSRW